VLRKTARCYRSTVATDFSGGMVRDNPERNRHVAEMTALGRVGLPDAIGPMIAALLSEENRWVNAQRIEALWGMGAFVYENATCEASITLDTVHQ
jgi:hypothetical protein